ncbi:hypothetical protein UFOVP131_13 [uncultured Caudovirales phage]|uniref:Uncharacterized protein n=1 Tax=uncultured Caudovirales phage TaxID=2100421 RepID=A0A6J5LDV1_9CAUD|nr:hypothetical protein UFOVP131_13 [uncultured Caudovirales phage]
MAKQTNATLQAALAQLQGELQNERAMRAADERLHANDVAQYKATVAGQERQLKDERESHNLTRDVLHSTELELAKTRGYLDAMQDAQPPVMVPQSREGHLASYADGSRSVSAGWRNDGYGQTPNKSWWLR